MSIQTNSADSGYHYYITCIGGTFQGDVENRSLFTSDGKRAIEILVNNESLLEQISSVYTKIGHLIDSTLEKNLYILSKPILKNPIISIEGLNEAYQGLEVYLTLKGFIYKEVV